MAPRSKRYRRVGSPPVLKGYKPIGLQYSETSVVSLLYEEYEALRLADYAGLKQEEAAKIMNVSRPTFSRIYDSCLRKLAKAFAEGCSITIEGGDVEFDKQWYRCNDCTTVFHHPDDAIQECIKCESENIEHINRSIRDWKEGQVRTKSKPDENEYCVCPNCNYELKHQKRVPCFSLACPNCHIPLLRQGD